jgi:hypothetical protein
VNREVHSTCTGPCTTDIQPFSRLGPYQHASSRRTKTTTKTSFTLSPLSTSYDIGCTPMLEVTINISSTPSALPVTPLLLLPLEVRNHIFQYALTSQAPLRYQPPVRATFEYRFPTAWPAILYEAKRTWTSTLSPRSAFSQLKYVCKQLYAEMAGLEVKFNLIVFAPVYWTGKSAEEWFLEFVQTMAPSKIAWISTAVIESDARCLSSNQDRSPETTQITALVGICKKHPSITMKYVF